MHPAGRKEDFQPFSKRQNHGTQKQSIKEGKVSMNSLFRKMLAAALSLTVTVQALAPVIGQNARTASAGETNGSTDSGTNVFKAVGIDNEKLDTHNPDDETSNPYGKTSMTIGSAADEVYVGTMGKEGGVIIGDGVSDVGSHNTVNTEWVPLENRVVSGEKGKKGIIYGESGLYDETLSKQNIQTYISDICIGCSAALFKPETKARNAVTDNGYQIIDHDLNIGAGAKCGYVFMGYKTTTDIDKAISDIIIVDYTNIGNKKPPKYFDYEGRRYWRAHAYGYNCEEEEVNYGDLNYMALTGSHDLYAYYTTDKMYYTYYDGVQASIAGSSIQQDLSKFYVISKIDFDTRKRDFRNGGIRSLQLDKNNNVIRDSVSYKSLDLNLGAGDASEDTYMKVEQEIYTHASVEGSTLKPENTSAFQKTNSYINKTAGGNFDGNQEGQKYQYAMVSFDGENLLLTVTDTRDPSKSTGQINLGGLTVPGTDAKSYSVKQLEAIAKMNIVTGDFDGNGYDEIAVYVPAAEGGSKVKVFRKKVPAGSGMKDNYVPDNTDNWEQKYQAAVNTPNDIITLSAGDVNADGADDLVIADSTNVRVISGSHNNAMALKTETVLCNGTNLSAAVFRAKYSGYDKNMIGIMGIMDGKNQLMVFMFSGQDKKQHDIYSKLGETEVSFINVSEYEKKFPLQRELVYANGVFSSPYLEKEYCFNEGKMQAYDKEESELNAYISNPEYTSDILIPYDLQTAVLNKAANAVQTVFYHYLLLERDKPNDAQFALGAYSPNAGYEEIVMNPMSYGWLSNPQCYAVVNTDKDTSYMQYTGKHWFEYTNPSILAVISAPPCFRDLLGRNDFSANSYDDSSTRYGSAKSTGSSESNGVAVYAGIFARYHEQAELPGGKTIAEFEAELEISENYTWSDASGQTQEFALEFSNDPTADQVVFYSIPYECYEYEMYFEDRSEPETRIVCIPQQACISQLTLDEYLEIAKSQPDLPQLTRDVVDHTVGMPDTYPRISARFSDSVETDLSYNKVPYKGNGNSQSITITNSSQHIESSSFSAIAKAGAGAGGVVVGASEGVGHEWEKNTEQSDSVTYGGTINAMPKEAEERGYGMSWKIFAYKQSYTDMNGDKVEFPVVDYLVSDVTQPPLLPQDFRQDFINSSKNSIKLDWEYAEPNSIQAFKIFRVSSVNGQDNSEKLIGTIDAQTGVLNENGTYSYTLTDYGQYQDVNGLLPGMEYTYYIQSVNTKMLDPISIPSEHLKAYTHADMDTPEVSLINLTDGNLTMYPDRSYSVQALVKKPDTSSNIRYSDITYQWQKKDSKNHWNKLMDENSDMLSIADPVADHSGEYRCRIDIEAYDQTAKKKCNATVFTDVFTLTFAHRPVQIDAFSVSSDGQFPNAEIKLSPSDENCFSAPIGNVVFTVSGANYERNYTVPLVSDGRNASCSLASAADLEAVSDGVYEITAHYAGSSWFGSQASDAQKILIGSDTVLPILFNGTQRTNTFNCGDEINVKFIRYLKDESGNVTETEVTHDDMELVAGQTDAEGNITYYPLNDLLPGQYTVYAIKMLADDTNDPDAPKSVPLTIMPKQIDLAIAVPEMVQGNIKNIPVIWDINNALIQKSDLAELAELTFKNNKDSKISISADGLKNSLSGTYYADLKAKKTDTAKKYDIKLHPTSFEILPVSYNLQMTVDTAGQVGDAVTGSITYSLNEETIFSKITNEAVAFIEEQKVQLTAVPAMGYQFDHWVLSTNSKPIKTQTISVTMPAGDVIATAYFKLRPGKINLVETGGGTVSKPEGFTSQKEYPLNTPLTFTAEDKDGVEFKGWVLVVNGKAQDIPTRTVTLTVSEDKVDLYALYGDAVVTLPVIETTTTESTTASTSTTESTTSSTASSKSTITFTSTTESTTASTSTSKSTTASTSTSKSTTASTSTSKSTSTSTSKSITTSTSITESATTSASVSTGISSSVSETSPTVSTSGTTVSAETTTSAVQSETTTSTESASSTTETTSAVPERIPGDVNGDGIVNLKDVTLIRRSIAGGWNVTIDESAADVNGDHAVNLKDVTLIRRYIAGGWNVTLK